MEQSDKTARQLFEHVQANPTRKRFGFGKVPALINIDSVSYTHLTLPTT
jgi:maleamate amidohydrolase